MITLSDTLDTPTDEQRMIADSARAFFADARGAARARALRGHQPGYCPETWREMAELGWVGLRVPEAFGGSAGRFEEFAVLAEYCGSALAPEPLLEVGLLGAGVLARAANEPLKNAWLPQIVAGEKTVMLAWQEPGRGQNAAAQTVRAAPQGNEVVLNGIKCFVPNGAAADAFIVSAWDGAGMALYFVPANASGLVLQHQRRVDGGYWTELVLEDVRIDAENTVAVGQAAEHILQHVLEETRMGICAQLVGLMDAVLHLAVEHLKTREQFGKPIGSFQALQHRAADQLVQIEIARSVLLRNLALWETPLTAEQRELAASQTKARCVDAALAVTKSAIQMFGGMGYTDEVDVGLYLKRAMVLGAWLGGVDWHRERYGDLRMLGVSIDTAQGLDPALKEVSAWIEENFPESLRFPDHRLDSSVATDWLERLHAKGLAAPGWPKEYGGMGLTAYQQVQFQEICDRVGMNIAPNLGASMLGPLLIQYGTEAQKKEHLPKILSGEVRWCQGYSEPGAGSDLANIRTTAVLDGDEFVVNGQKIWTSFAYDAQKIFMLVRTDPSARKQDGISFLLADMDTPGITIRRIVNLTGSAEFCEVFFDNVRVPRENLVGPLNGGWKMAKSLLGSERIMLGSPRLAKYPLNLLDAYAQTKGLKEDPCFLMRYTQLELEVEDLGAAFIRMVEAMRRGQQLGAEISVLKLWVTETFQRVADLIFAVGEEVAASDETCVIDEHQRMHPANLFLAARAATIYGGSSEIQRNILAKQILRLPNG